MLFITILLPYFHFHELHIGPQAKKISSENSQILEIIYKLILVFGGILQLSKNECLILSLDRTVEKVNVNMKKLQHDTVKTAAYAL